MRHWHWWLILAATGFFPAMGVLAMWRMRNSGPHCLEYLVVPIGATPFFVAAIVAYLTWRGRKADGALGRRPSSGASD